MNKKINRIRRASSTRKKLYKLNVNRLVVHRTLNHIYAQIISPDNSQVLVSASTVEYEIKKSIDITGNKKAACFIGKIIAERALKKGIKHISFDRSGFKYHGRIKSLAEAARDYGLVF